MPYLGNIPATNFSTISYQDLTGGTGTSFTLDFPAGSAQDIEVFVNNVRQEPGVAYTVAGTSLTMTGSIVATDDFYVVFQGKAQQSVTHPTNSALQATTGTFSGVVTIDRGSATGTHLEITTTGSGHNFDMTDSDSTARIRNVSGNLRLSADHLNEAANSRIQFEVDGSEAARLDTSGTLLVGMTSDAANTVGIRARGEGLLTSTRDGSQSAIFGRQTSDGDIVVFEKDGTTRGAIGCIGNDIYIDGLGSSGSGIRFESNQLRPRRGGGDIDNSVDLGGSNFRFDDVFASNGTIQTSDANEKQQIASLTAAEITAATAISKLFKTFKWNSAVEAKGDAARTHTGLIAQQVETAMTDAGLDAGDYAFFISTDWYVDADGNEVEADAEGAIAKNRKGIRYPELLSFVGAATEQRLADIETRLTALENV